jgi:hypothetical protein
VTVNANVPSARQAAGHCVDGQGVLWMYGGTGIDASGTFGALSDMWKFDGTNWTWVAGSNTANVIANWGTQNVESATNTPGGRQTPLFCGPTSTNLRLSGGYAFSNSSFASLYPNWPNGPQDVWDFDITTGQWVWRAGNNNTASEITQNLGTTGVPSPSVIPFGGLYPSWMDSDGTLWFLGIWGSTQLMKWK